MIDQIGKCLKNKFFDKTEEEKVTKVSKTNVKEQEAKVSESNGEEMGQTQRITFPAVIEEAPKEETKEDFFDEDLDKVE